MPPNEFVAFPTSVLPLPTAQHCNVVAAPDIVATTDDLNCRHFETPDVLKLPTFCNPDLIITAEMSPDLMNPDVKQLTHFWTGIAFNV